MIDGYFNMFGEKPKMMYLSTLEKNDHSELDTRNFLDEKDI